MLDSAASPTPKSGAPLEEKSGNNGITTSSDASDPSTPEKEEARGQTDSPLVTSATSLNEPPKEYVKPARAYSVMFFLTLVIFSSSITNGMITTGLPAIASEIGIPPQTMYWPLAVYSLTAGTCLIAAGTVADVVGARRVFLTGTILLSAFTLGCSLSRTGLQLTMFRAMQGIAMALCLPSSVGVICQAIAPGRLRNLAFACTGLGQPLGFSLGLILAGVFIKTIGWRPGWYLVAGLFFVCFPAGFLVLPRDRLVAPPSLRRLRTHVDWPGAAIASACLAMLAVVLVQLSENQDHIREPAVIGMLAASLALIPAFVWWMYAAARRGRPVLIPNALWRRVTFSSVCVMVMMSYAVMQTLELYVTLFFQKVQGLDALQSSIRLLPSLLIGALLNLTVGLVMHRVSAMWLVFSSSLACAGAPLLMALIDPAWPYWYAAFPAQVLHPLSADVLFCVGLVTISKEFSDDTKALAGAVFNTMAQFGTSIGLAIIGIVASSVTRASRFEDKESAGALFEGYKGAFWTSLGLTLATAALALVGLRKVGCADTGKEADEGSRYGGTG